MMLTPKDTKSQIVIFPVLGLEVALPVSTSSRAKRPSLQLRHICVPLSDYNSDSRALFHRLVYGPIPSCLRLQSNQGEAVEPELVEIPSVLYRDLETIPASFTVLAFALFSRLSVYLYSSRTLSDTTLTALTNTPTHPILTLSTHQTPCYNQERGGLITTSSATRAKLVAR